MNSHIVKFNARTHTSRSCGLGLVSFWHVLHGAVVNFQLKAHWVLVLCLAG